MGTADIVTAQHALLNTALSVSSKGGSDFTTSTALGLDPVSPAVRVIMRLTVNELYKKGCQEQTSASTGGRDDFGLDLQPTVGVSAPRFAEGFCSGRFALAVVFSAGGDNANRV
jgi:hypothetical protein